MFLYFILIFFLHMSTIFLLDYKRKDLFIDESIFNIPHYYYYYFFSGNGIMYFVKNIIGENFSYLLTVFYNNKVL